MSELKIPKLDKYKIEVKEPGRTFSMVMYSKEQVDNIIHKLLTEITELKGYNNVLEKRKDGIQKPVSTLEFNPPTVKIGDTLWMAENLAYDDDGKGIFYNPKNKQYYYTWSAAKRVAKKLGWKLPSDEDWNKACKECGDIKVNEWDDYEKCSLKEKLRIKLVGYCYNGSYYNVGSNGYFWSVSEYSSSSAWYRYFGTSASVTRDYDLKEYGYSLRLVKDS